MLPITRRLPLCPGHRNFKTQAIGLAKDFEKQSIFAYSATLKNFVSQQMSLRMSDLGRFYAFNGGQALALRAVLCARPNCLFYLLT